MRTNTMMRSLFAKTLYDKRWFTLGWSLGTLCMVLLVVAFYPSFSEGDALDKLTKSLPEQFKAFIGDTALLKTIPGYLAEQILNLRITLLLMIMSIILGLSLSVAEEERGTLRTLVATPLSRTRLLLEKWAAGIMIMLIVSLSTVAGIYIGLAGINASADNGFIWSVFLLCWVFGTAALSIPLGLGLGTGSRAVATVATTTLIVGSFILSTFGKAVSWLGPIEKLSIMHYYDATAIARGGLVISHLFVLSGVVVAMVAFGLLGFRKRDVD